MSVLTITGPTCAGKSTIERELQRMGCGRVISHTTRLPRAGESQGVDYHYVSDFEYSQLKNEGAFIEMIELGTRRYGVSKQALRAALEVSSNVAIVVDPHGAAQILEFCKAEGLPKYSVWIDCSPLEQARRWVLRLATDCVDGKGLASYSERLSLMLTDEVRWRKFAESSMIDFTWPYDRKIITTSAVSPRECAGLILNSLAVK